MSMTAVGRGQLLQPHLPDNASIKLIGLGGVGQIVARYSAVFLASLGGEVRLVLIDGDRFEPANAGRMLFGSCGNKAVVTKEQLLPHFTDSTLTILAIDEYLTADNIGRLIQEGDILVLSVDNHATRRLVDSHCARLREICLISGGNDGIGTDPAGVFRRGTYGNTQVHIRRDGRDLSPPLSWHHPEIETPADRLPTEQSCTDIVASMPQILFANLAVASAMLNTLWLYLCGALHYGELSFDIADGLMRPVTRIEATPLPLRLSGMPSPSSPTNAPP